MPDDKLSQQHYIECQKAILIALRQFSKKQQLQRQQQIRNRLPPKLNGKANFGVSLILVAIVILLNNSNKIMPQSSESKLLSSTMVRQKVQDVFHLVVQHRTITYVDRIEDCQPYMFYFDSFCSKKAVDLEIDITFHIGYEPVVNSLEYNKQQQRIQGEWGQLKILSTQNNVRLISQENGYINEWSLQQYSNKTDQKVALIQPVASKAIMEKIKNQIQSNNGVEPYKERISRQIIDIYSKNSAQSLLQAILEKLNTGLDTILGSTIPPKQKKSQNYYISENHNKITHVTQHQFIVQEQNYTQSQLVPTEQIGKQNKISEPKCVQHQIDQQKKKQNHSQQYLSQKVNKQNTAQSLQKQNKNKNFDRRKAQQNFEKLKMKI